MHDHDNDPTSENNDDRYSLQEDLAGKWKALQWAFTQWRWVGAAAVVGLLAGLAYFWITPVSYTARTSFVVEDAKTSGGMLSAIAGQFGFDLGSMSGGNGVLAGDNVLELLKSRSLIKKTLLTTGADSTETLADRYAASKKWTAKWAASKKVGYEVKFKPLKQKSRVEDSLLQVIVKEIVEKDLAVAKPDRKLGFFEMTVTMRDEELGLLFSQRLLKAATAFYIETRTRRLATNVARLQAKADTLERLLNRKTFTAAASNKMLIDINPVYTAPDAVAEISSRDKMVQSTIYAEVMKNLEVSKMALIQETPTVQVVDEPERPLRRNKVKLLPSLLLFSIAAVLIVVVSLTLRHKN